MHVASSLIIEIAGHGHLKLLLHHILLLLLMVIASSASACRRVVIGVLGLEAWVQVGIGLIDAIEASLDDACMLQLRALVTLERLIDVRIATIFGHALLPGQKPNRGQIMRRV